MSFVNFVVKIPVLTRASIGSYDYSRFYLMKAKPAELILSLAVLSWESPLPSARRSCPAPAVTRTLDPTSLLRLSAGGLILLGIWLLYETFSGGWRNASPGRPAARGEHRFSPSALYLGERRTVRCRSC